MSEGCCAVVSTGGAATVEVSCAKAGVAVQSAAATANGLAAATSREREEILIIDICPLKPARAPDVEYAEFFDPSPDAGDNMA